MVVGVGKMSIFSFFDKKRVYGTCLFYALIVDLKVFWLRILLIKISG